MSPSTDRVARAQALLSEFAELAMDLARDLHDAAKAAETCEEKARLAQEFHRVGRGLRQSLALAAKLERDEARAAREAEVVRTAATETAVAQRKTRLRARIEQLVWSEMEHLDAKFLEEPLTRAVARAELSDDFLEAPLEALIERIWAELGFRPPGEADDEDEGEDDLDWDGADAPQLHVPP